MSFSNIALRVINHEANAIHTLAKHFELNLIPIFNQIINHLLNFTGRIITTGVGKSGHIARKVAASFASTGNPAYYVNLAEASHGDLGMICKEDLVIIFSNSGQNSELTSIIDYCNNLSIKTIGVTSQLDSLLAKNCTYLLSLPKTSEASNIIAPTTSPLMMLAMGDALMTALHEAKNFSSEDYRIFHPGGKIGQILCKISDIMLPVNEIVFANGNDTFEAVIEKLNQSLHSCIMIIDQNLKILGIITNYDLRKALITLPMPLRASDIMNRNFKFITTSNALIEAQNLFEQNSISFLPVLEDKQVIGLITPQCLKQN